MIIGLTGSFGAGKGAVVDYLINEKGFTHFSASGFIGETVKERKLALNRDSLIQVANELRAEHGPSYIVETLYKQAQLAGGNVVIESLRAVAEVEKIKELGGVVIGIDADPEIRYSRARARGSAKDDVSYEKWLLQERQETNPDDPTKQDLRGALNRADYIIMNNGALEELHNQVEEILARIG